MAAHSEYPAVDPAQIMAQAVSQGSQGDATETSAQDGASPSPTPSVQWSPPTQPELGPAEDTGADAPTPRPAVQWHPSAAPDDQQADPEASLAPRVELSGPGTPKWKVVTYVSQTTTIDDNIFISHTEKQSDVYFDIAPGFAAGWGDFRSALLLHDSRFTDQYGQTREPVADPLDGDFAYFNYTADAQLFAAHDSQDAVNSDVNFSSQWEFSKMQLGLNARFVTLTGPDVDVGTRTRRDIFTIDATAKYTLSDKTSLDFEASGDVADYATQLSSTQWQAQLYLDYQMFPKTSIGVGVVGGIRTLEDSTNQYYQQLQVRATYDPTGRLELNLNGGLELDEASGGSTQWNPVFGVGASYAITDTDTISLNAQRQTVSSAVTASETEDVTSINLQGRHRIFGGFSIGCGVGYTHTDYYSEGLSTLSRTDNYIFVRPSLAYDFAEWSQVELAYEYHRDISTDEPFEFVENLASLQFNFVF